MKLVRLFTGLCLAALTGFPATALDRPVLKGTASVIDGDTIEIRGQRLRLHGIDAPESGQLCHDANNDPWRCGKEAAFALSDKIGRRPVSCNLIDQDRYGRWIAICEQNGKTLNAWLVREGWAIAYTRFSDDYVREERAARRAKRGIWQGSFVAPEDWRRGTRLPPKTKPANCNIKGNINSKGDRIYHVPGGKWYDRTTVNTSKGQRWFCSEAEARAAGWRKSKS
ncbi:endonuclease YncB(thermonuclease family) [Shimia isoporae]|uniref:Endonuclease YncB(Thermonuclease family) n=1 Tax=Shimia isoporae TaxID=647720 RepID=A0A4R1NNC7_9RHOB|nr:thermonuclease family protein [Shimia isoporae]TCL09301.1 endonuclease YncB(thermonuclease family) [Shimia isoporae]